MANLPQSFRTVRFEAEMIPGHLPHLGLSGGSNCQRYAYAVLAYFGRVLPDLRSDQLWLDDAFTVAVTEPETLDLVLFAAGPDPWGAHVGVFLGDSCVLHRCKEIGMPAVWNFQDFGQRERYRCRIGFKRVYRG